MLKSADRFDDRRVFAEQPLLLYGVRFWIRQNRPGIGGLEYAISR